MSNVNIWLWVLALIIAYLLGNISPSTLLAKAKGIDTPKTNMAIKTTIPKITSTGSHTSFLSYTA